MSHASNACENLLTSVVCGAVCEVERVGQLVSRCGGGRQRSSECPQVCRGAVAATRPPWVSIYLNVIALQCQYGSPDSVSDGATRFVGSFFPICK